MYRYLGTATSVRITSATFMHRADGIADVFLLVVEVGKWNGAAAHAKRDRTGLFDFGEGPGRFPRMGLGQAGAEEKSAQLRTPDAVSWRHRMNAHAGARGSIRVLPQPFFSYGSAPSYFSTKARSIT